MAYENNDKKNESVYSKRIRAGKRRTYFFDVRATRGNDYFLTITESRKRFDDNGYDRHKIFLYKEDFDSFTKGLEEMISFVKKEQGETPQREERRWISEVENTKEVEQEEIKPKSFFDKFKF